MISAHTLLLQSQYERQILWMWLNVSALNSPITVPKGTNTHLTAVDSTSRSYSSAALTIGLRHCRSRPFLPDLQDATCKCQFGCLGNTERLADSPVEGRVDHDSLGTIFG